MNTATNAKATYHEVVWGDDDRDRVAYVDHHDGTYLSSVAATDAHRYFLYLQRCGTEVGLYQDGVFQVGTDISGSRPAFLDDPKLYALWAAGQLNEDGTAKATAPAEHKTRTVLDAYQDERYVTKSNGSCGRWVNGDTSTAICLCGWKWHAGSRAEARLMARGHRNEAAA